MTGMTRRRFLGRSATIGMSMALPTVVPRSVLGAAAPSNRIGIGMIGMGRQAYHANLGPFLNSPQTQVVAVCDVDSRRLDNARQKVEGYYAEKSPSGTYRGCVAVRDFRRLLARTDVDAVMISTPDHWHVPMSILAAEAGKDVCCEKPLTLCIGEGRALCHAVERYHRVTRTDSEFRSIRRFSRACELVRNGRIGRLHTIRSGSPREAEGIPQHVPMPVPQELDYDLWLGPAPEAPYTEKRVHPQSDYSRPGWMRISDYCDGMISNWGAHLNDIAQWGNNTERTGPVEVEGQGTFSEGLWNTLIDFKVRYRYANGVEHFYEMSSPFVRFEGTEGWVQANWSGELLQAHPRSLLDEVIGPDEIHLATTDEKTDFINAVKTRSKTLAPFEVGHRTTSLCQLGLIAIKVGRKLQWDPAAERFVNDDVANRFLSRAMRSPWRL